MDYHGMNPANLRSRAEVVLNGPDLDRRVSVMCLGSKVSDLQKSVQSVLQLS